MSKKITLLDGAVGTSLWEKLKPAAGKKTRSGSSTSLIRKS